MIPMKLSWAAMALLFILIEFNAVLMYRLRDVSGCQRHAFMGGVILAVLLIRMRLRR